MESSSFGINEERTNNYMGNIAMPKPQSLSKEELSERQYKQKTRELKIARTRAGVLRKQITEAYQTLENIRFDYLSDTAFRDKIVEAKRSLESAINDFLLDDSYWSKSVKEHQKMSHQEYAEKLETQTTGQPTQSN